MNKSKIKSQNSQSKKKKKVREIDSYKIQFKTKIKEKSNINSKEKERIKNKTNKYSQSNFSAKTLNQKPSSSLIKEYNSQNLINNNALSYSNYAFSEMEESKKNEINKFIDSSKYNNEDFNTLNSNIKMDINDLSNTNNKKISMRIKDKNICSEKDINFQKNKFSKRAEYSMPNKNEKIFDNYLYNKSSNLKKYNYETSLGGLENNLNIELDMNSFKKISPENLGKDLKNKNESIQCKNINSKNSMNKEELKIKKIYKENNNNIEISNNNKKYCK